MKRIKIWGAAISILFVAATFCFTSTANADLVTFEFFSGNDLGAALENAGDDFTGTSQFACCSEEVKRNVRTTTYGNFS